MCSCSLQYLQAVSVAALAAHLEVDGDGVRPGQLAVLLPPPLDHQRHVEAEEEGDGEPCNTVLYCTALYCTVLYCTGEPCNTAQASCSCPTCALLATPPDQLLKLHLMVHREAVPAHREVIFHKNIKRITQNLICGV